MLSTFKVVFLIYSLTNNCSVTMVSLYQNISFPCYFSIENKNSISSNWSPMYFFSFSLVASLISFYLIFPGAIKLMQTSIRVSIQIKPYSRWLCFFFYQDLNAISVDYFPFHVTEWRWTIISMFFFSIWIWISLCWLNHFLFTMQTLFKILNSTKLVMIRILVIFKRALISHNCIRQLKCSCQIQFVVGYWW